jgi:CheY-like chemotaxis protein
MAEPWATGIFLAQVSLVQRLATSLPVAISAPVVPLAAAVPRHVLIADANDRTLAVRAEQLTAAGLRVSRARTSFEAIVKASCHVPDCILLDGSLTDLDPADTLQLLLTCPVTKDIPIFRLTPGRRVPARVVAATLGPRL